MKKIITILTLSLVALSMFSNAQSHKRRFSPRKQNHSSASYKADAVVSRMDSTYGYGWDKTAGWDNYFRAYPTYNSDSTENYTIEMVLNQNNVWENGYKTTYTYDAQKNVLTELSQEWNAATSAWLNTNNSIYTYNANNNRTSTINQGWQSGAWVNNNKFIYNFDANYRAISDLYQSWNVGTSSWENLVQNVYKFNTSNLVDSAITQYWNGSTSAWVSYILVTYTYDANKNQTSSLFQSWDTQSSSWKNTYSHTFTYDLNKNMLTDLFKTYNVGGTWDNTELDTYTYDADNNQLSEVYQDWVIASGNWLNTDSSHYYYTKKNTNPNNGVALLNVANKELNIYPNPATNIATINFETTSKEILTIVNLLGEQVYTQSYIANQTIDLSSFSKGIYIVKVGTAVGKLVVE
ncbi:MAG: T9SS type A sorting domain-containing protein [Bacteroidetes bacterium]|nr:T9SS type A sorting domain-containing protein [Bacteroidota bacterium]